MNSNWTEVALAEFAEINPKRTLKRDQEAPFVGMSDLGFGRDIDVDALERRVYKGGGTRFQNGDTLLARITPSLENGKTALVSGLAPGQVGHGSTEFIVLGPRTASDVLFLYYLARTPAFREHAIQSMEGTTGRQRVPTRAVSEYRFRCPPPRQREMIGELLGTLDDKIALLTQMNTTLESMAQALFKSWFIDFDPVHAKAAGKQPEGMDAETAAMFPSGFEDSELGSIPKGWAIDTIGNVIDTVSGTTPSTRNPEFWQPDEYWWATPKDLSGLSSPVLIKTERRISEAGLARISSGLLPKGTLLMSSRAPIGYLAIAQVPTAINQGFIGMLPGETLTPEYMLFWCRLNMETIVQHANGSTFLEISRSSFRRIQIVVPSAPLVSKFTEIAALLLQRIAENERYVKTLAELRDTLLPRLVSGKLRIPEAKELVEEAVS